ncbi:MULTISPECIES: hypothetical protein [unclassified Nostoc]|uniref:hypothetical protein n=1 Tax=unclassified Nostoc TaxID=2593658 RepID=UPI002AD1F475|nr:hypothetical protein [Nostoc sp. DedQUE03]MDZ7976894.1 hypothetical protein [Nostoc sp. DedQUE03]MDZ8043359.1 hypothetical protein [Nostoc sp. DedQUE02]
MNIIEQTSTKLKFQTNDQQWLWGVLFGLPFVAIGFGIAIVTSNLTTLECQRTKPNQMTCQRTIAGLLGTETTFIPGQLTGAYVMTASGTGVVLNISKIQKVELVSHRVIVREKHSQIANEINAFIHNPQQPALKIQQDDRWEGFFSGVVFFLPGIGVILQSLTIPMQVLCDFDKISGLITLKKRYQLFGTFTTEKKLTEIQQVEVIQVPLPTRIPWYLVQLQLISAQSIFLSAPTRDRQQCQIIVNAINQFLRFKLGA